jgi:hypothetical protein
MAIDRYGDLVDLRHGVVDLISRCRDEYEIDKQVEILHAINLELPQSKQIRIPSFITNDYVSRALDIAEATS